MVFDLIADQAGGDFDHAPLHRDAELFDEHDFLRGGDGEDSDGGVSLGAAHEIPPTYPIEREPTGFKQQLRIGHDFKWGKETMAQQR